jgi:hypothetical protein
MTTFHFFFAVFLFYILFLKKKRADLLLIIFLILASVIYMGLFLIQFIHHDYYFIAVIPSIILIVSIANIDFLKKIKSIALKNMVCLLILILSLVSLNFAKLNMHRRYTNNIDFSSIVHYQLRDANVLLDSLDIKKYSKFIVVGDRTQNGSLVLLNRFGWTYANFNQDFGSLKTNLPFAQYLLVLKPSANKLPEELRKDLSHCQVINFRNNSIYNLQNYKK